ncbi:TonB-dependent receptor [Sphingomonas sp. ABOLD]|uniref:Outer membrane receptor protein involved in Fe transport n=1 Tax=Sphingomonas trueperi TaxID=53317 RepID=A0A7X6BDA7_9SPHN|nr:MULTISPECIES: TonB-dependent receptor [Sphingomonas]NJB98115.1 outer membrane receptor protein involved in Fe transport [Sphingomonas trueperi]RSV42284.1 TonB-dependent receptor [Sphingomonas sp. ABOLE]RSV46352.1 TonB-dependent receptor [Sphingomonas sp. ABOLD]
MTKKQTKLRGGIALSAVVLAGALLSAPAMAQDTVPASDGANDGGQEIVITGSRIARRNLESAAPVATVSAEEFQLSGTVNVEQVINTLPQVIPGTTAFSNNPGGGVSTLNLRGLGEQRTLVLVNGRRWVSYDTAQIVDLNTIPAFLIDRVEVVSGGASAVYGSDALAGVVNFTLNNNLDGMIAGGQYSVTGRGDGPRYEAYVAMGGKIGDRGHATVYAEYFNREAIFQGARSFSSSALGENGTATGLVPAGSSTTPNGRVTSTYAAGACPTGNVFCSPGAYYTAPGVSRPRTGTDLYNFAPDNYLQVPQERYMLGGYADYEIADGHTAYAEVTYVNNRVANELAPTPVTGTFQVNINAVSPFLSARDVAALRQLDTVAATGNTVGDGVVPLAIQRRINETGSRNSLDERNAFRVLVGVRGDITESLNYDIYYNYARTRNANVQAGNISRSAFQAGLDGTANAINIFGPGTMTSGMVDQVSILAQNGDSSELQVVNGSISGSVFNFGLGAEDVGFALGGEYRKMTSRFIPDTALASGDVIGFNAGDPTAGSYSAKEVFGELRVPIIAGKPFVHELELNGAARYSDYSLTAVGGVWAYAAGAKWAPVRDFAIRGQYQRAVRAPNVGELFGGQAINFPTAQDPCALATAASNATIRNLCIATGVPAAAVGTAGLQLNTQIQSLQGGNPNLTQETSDSYTAGAVFTPSFLPGLTATVDWYNIKVDNQISTLGGGLANTLNLCYNVIQNISSVYCQAFVGKRNALGQFDGVNAPAILNANVGKLEVEGIDVEVNYARSLGFGLLADTSRLSVNVMGTYTIKSNSTPVAELPDTVNRCAGKFGLVCGNPTPKYKWTSRLTWVDGMLTSSVRWRHLSSVNDDDSSTTYFVEKIPSYDLFDLSFAAELDKKFTFSIGVNNLFDKKPTILGNNQQQANTYPATYDVLGRDFFVSGRFKF